MKFFFAFLALSRTNKAENFPRIQRMLKLLFCTKGEPTSSMPWVCCAFGNVYYLISYKVRAEGGLVGGGEDLAISRCRWSETIVE